VLGRQKTWSYFASQEPRKESKAKQSKGTEGVITSATIGGQSSEVGNFVVVVVIVVVCQEILHFFVRALFVSLAEVAVLDSRQESTVLWSLRMCVKILRVVVGRKKMMVLCIGNTKELLLLRSSSSAALLAHAFLLPQFL